MYHRKAVLCQQLARAYVSEKSLKAVDVAYSNE